MASTRATRWACVTGLAAAWVLSGIGAAVAQGVLDLDGDPRQSTTGPEPPPGVAPKEGQAGADLGGSSKTIADVPAYLWRHGCGPTAVGMVIGYYDVHGFDDLFAGSAATQTADVNQGIASQEDAANPRHYEDYSLPIDSGAPSALPDKSQLPMGDEHPHDCVADFMRTSWSFYANFYGWSWSTHVNQSFVSYVQLRNPQYVPTCQRYRMSTGALNWEVLTGEIDSDRPMVFLVDTDGDGGTDHFVTVVGYRDTPSQQYGCLDTWSPADIVRWCDFEPMAGGQPWGVWAGWAFGLSVSDQPPARSYNAGVGTLPTAQGWLLYDTDPSQPDPCVADGALHQGPTGPTGIQVSARMDLAFNFADGDFTLEATLRVTESTHVDDCRGGYVLSAADILGRVFNVWIASDRILLFNIANADCSGSGQVLSFDTTDAYHDYRLRVDGIVGRLSIDGDPNAVLELAVGPTSESANLNTVGFGDNAADAWSETLCKRIAYGNALYDLTITVVKDAYGCVAVEPSLPGYLPGTGVTLTAEPNEGKRFVNWKLYDPNYPGDANHVAVDGNNPITIVMDADRQVKAVFKCGDGGMGQGLELLMIGVGFCGLASRRIRRSA